MSDLIPIIIETLGSKQKSTKKSELSNILSTISEIKLDLPSKGMYEDIILDYSYPDSTMMNRKDDLADRMAEYSALTNNYKVSSIKFKDRLKLLKDKWGDELGMSKEERRNEFKPFLEDMMPIMEDKNNEFEIKK